jgi:NADH-quinone oxidoreductase subunit C
MTPEELVAHLQEVDASAVERHELQFGQLSVWVPAAKWQGFARHLKGCGRCRFDMITFICGVDWPDDNEIEIVAHFYSVRRQHKINMKIRVPREDGRVPTLTGVWRGADWHERETAELYGVIFEGHPHLVKLLLPEAFEGYPMRKDFLLMTREAKEWEGREEPGAPGSSPRPGRVPTSVGASPARGHAAAAVAAAPSPAEGGPAAPAASEEPAPAPAGSGPAAEEPAADAKGPAPEKEEAAAEEPAADAKEPAPEKEAAAEPAADAKEPAPEEPAAEAKDAAAEAKEAAAEAKESAAEAKGAAAEAKGAAADEPAAPTEDDPAGPPSDRGDA